MKRVGILALFLLLVTLIPSAAYAQRKYVLPKDKTASPTATVIPLSTPTPYLQYEFPYPGILPDHPLYPFKVLRDRILLFLTRDVKQKMELDLLFADKRLMMGKALVEKGKIELGASTISKGEKYFSEAVVHMENLTLSPTMDTSLIDRLFTAAKKHEEVITKLMEITPIGRRQGLEVSLTLSRESQQKIAVLMETKR